MWREGLLILSAFGSIFTDIQRLPILRLRRQGYARWASQKICENRLGSVWVLKRGTMGAMYTL